VAGATSGQVSVPTTTTRALARNRFNPSGGAPPPVNHGRRAGEAQVIDDDYYSGDPMQDLLEGQLLDRGRK
jgi:hypothetical protein